MTIVLVPESLVDEIAAEAARVAPGIKLRPYSENPSQVVNGLDEAEVVLRWVAGQRFSQLVAEGPKVRWLHTASAGVDHVLTPQVRAKVGLTVTDSGPAFGAAISEWVLLAMLMAARRVREQIDRQREHRWEFLEQRELSGATVGAIGLGPIGRAVADRAKAFGMRVFGLRRTPSPVANVDEVLTGPDGLRRLVEESDYIVLAAALTGETRSIIGAEQIAEMKPAAWLINIARGGMVDQDALTAALREGRIGGACLDVFTPEPLPPDNPLWDMPNVYISPHNSGGGSPRLAERQKAIFLENLRRFAAGEPLENVVDFERGY